MTIYVDELQSYQQQANTAQGRRYFGEGKKSCHMFTDGDEAELTAFAQRIGLKPQWIQRTSLVHFDLTPNKRVAAVRAGAKEITRAEMLDLPLLRSVRVPPKPDEQAIDPADGMTTFIRESLYDPDTGQEAGHVIRMTDEYRAFLEGASE